MKSIINYSIALFIFSAASWLLAVAVTRWLLLYYTFNERYNRWKIKRKHNQMQKIKQQNDELEARWMKESYERTIN